jgi:hypothetical protein
MRHPQQRQRTTAAVLTLFTAVVAAGGCNNSRSSSGPTAPNSTVIGSGTIVTESTMVMGFSSVLLAGEGKVLIAVAGSESLTVTSDDNILPRLTFEVIGSELRLGTEANTDVEPSQGIDYMVTAAQLNGIRLTGVGEINAAMVDTTTFTVEHTGVGSMTAEGRADRQDVTISGVGSYRAPDLSSLEASVEVSGVTTVELRVSDRLEGSVGSGATLEYWGDPTIDVTGSGTVRRLGP